MDLETIVVFLNMTTIDTQTTNKSVPWRGGQDEDSLSMQLFIEALTKHVAMFLDAYASAFDCFKIISMLKCVICIWSVANG